jgi:DHA2 family multidrug resistance protein-like MFS transporter
MPTNTPTRSRAGRREWSALAVIALPCLLYSMDLTVLILALPSISASLHPSSTQLLWIIDIYGFLLAGSLITMGTLGDRITAAAAHLPDHLNAARLTQPVTRSPWGCT